MPASSPVSQVTFPTTPLYNVREKFSFRANEWFFSLAFLVWGATMVAWPHMFDRPFYESFKRFGPQSLWTTVILLIGTVRMAALIVNGAWRSTPLIRMVMAMLSCMVWLELTLGIFYVGYGTISISLYPIILIADLYNVYKAGGDIYLANAHAKNIKATKL